MCLPLAGGLSRLDTPPLRHLHVSFGVKPPLHFNLVYPDSEVTELSAGSTCQAHRATSTSTVPLDVWTIMRCVSGQTVQRPRSSMAGTGRAMSLRMRDRAWHGLFRTVTRSESRTTNWVAWSLRQSFPWRMLPVVRTFWLNEILRMDLRLA